MKGRTIGDSAYNSGSPYRTKARRWLEEAFSGGEVVGVPWHAVSAFLRVMTNPKLPAERFTLEQAVQIANLWLVHPSVRVLAPGEQYWPVFQRMLVEGRAAGALVTDAEIAALTIEYGGVLHTTDRDFARFPGLRWENPLIA